MCVDLVTKSAAACCVLASVADNPVQLDRAEAKSDRRAGLEELAGNAGCLVVEVVVVEVVMVVEMEVVLLLFLLLLLVVVLMVVVAVVVSKLLDCNGS